jgi:hypothetical protein
MTRRYIGFAYILICSGRYKEESPHAVKTPQSQASSLTMEIPISVISAQILAIAALFVEAVSWGIHCVAYAWSIHALTRSKRAPARFAFWGVAIFSTLFWLIGTTDIGFSLYITLKQLVYEEGAGPIVPAAVVLESVSHLQTLEAIDAAY